MTVLSKAISRPNNSAAEPPIPTLGNISLTSLRNQTLSHYVDDRYENSYSSIRAIANRFFSIRPFAIDANGKAVVPTPNVIEALSRPNQEMSGVDFRDALAVMTMVHDKVYILVHQQNGRFDTMPAKAGVREDQIAGFTFLEHVVEDWHEGALRYKVYVKTDTGTEERYYYPYQVAALYDTNPANLNNGYSPARAARRWITLEDYLADYQSGFFENGAVPAGQFIITAATPKEYDNIVDTLQARHRGAGKNDNVTYSHRPMDATGKPVAPQIEWVPFNVTNKDHSLKDIFAQANKKIDSVYGVSAFIRSIDEAPNYATAQVIERNFVENTVRPFAIKKWARFQHELNRITGGLGYGISFKLETPHIADEEKTKAEANKTIWETVKDMIASGFTLDSAINALDLPPTWKRLVAGTSLDTTINNDKPDVDEGDELDGAPSDIDHTHPRMELLIPKNLTKEDMANYEQQLKEPPRALMQKQVDKAVAALSPANSADSEGEASQEDKDTFVAAMMVIITTILLYGGISQWEEGRQLLLEAGIDNVPTGTYELTQDAIDRYEKYLDSIVTGYANDTADKIRAVLADANTNQLTQQQTEAALRNIMNTDEWRVLRLATSETNRSGSLSSIESMIKIEDETEANIERGMLHTGSDTPCEFCQVYLDVWQPVKAVMVEKGQEMVGAEGGTMVNNWDDNPGHDVHANGHCIPQYRVVK